MKHSKMIVLLAGSTLMLAGAAAEAAGPGGRGHHGGRGGPGGHGHAMMMLRARGARRSLRPPCPKRSGLALKRCW